MTHPTLSEADLQARVIDLARLRGWRVHHTRPARRADGRWSTPLTGHPGCPDLILARGGRVLLAELKAGRGRVSAEQEAWLAAAGECGRLWRPGDWEAIVEELR